jgi:ADP-ribose pyrophosphatase YjhB (NUDIX family)
MPSVTQWFKLITEIQAIAQSGLAYSPNEYDKERFQRLMEISAELAADCSEQSLDFIKKVFTFETGYATPKVDVRAFIFQNNKVLLVRERADGLWSLPGGWADVNETPAQSIVREVREEANYHVEVKKLLALWDKRKHNAPCQWPHIYKCFFHCEIIERLPAEESFEITAIEFFPLEKLPPLSMPRRTEAQLFKLEQLVNNTAPTQFD